MPYYDRTQLVDVTTATVLHNLVNGCLLIFFIQWIFLGDLRSAMIVGANIPFALFFSIIIMVVLGEDANLLSVGAIDFGIIVDAAVILVENVYRNFQSPPEARSAAHAASGRGELGSPTRRVERTRPAPDVERSVAAHSGQRLAGRQSGVLLHRDHRCGVHSAVHHAGRRRPDFRSDGANLRLRAGRGADRDLHGDAMPGLAFDFRTRQRGRDRRGARHAFRLYAGAALVAAQPEDHRRDRVDLSRWSPASSARGLAANFCRRSRKAICGFAPRCRRRYRSRPACRSSTKSAKFFCAIPKSSP